MKNISELEAERLALQQECDSAKTQAERNRLGQFATPPELALEITRLARRLFPSEDMVRFLDPAFGTGSFYSALLRIFDPKRVTQAAGFEIDTRYAEKALRLWREKGLCLRVEDFTAAVPPQTDAKFNLVVCNPPYVRHHHLTAVEKARLKKLARHLSGLNLSGLTGLYCYFLLLADEWVSEHGVCIWLIPAEFMDVNYGVPLKEYLLSKVTLLQVHRFASEDVQFTDALVSSSVVCFRKELPPKGHTVKFTFGGSLNKPRREEAVFLSELTAESKWNGRDGNGKLSEPQTKLADLFEIKRGLATGDNKFFILTKEKIRELCLPMKFFKPILPSPRHLPADEVLADAAGNPLLEQKLFLLDCRIPEEQLSHEYPNLSRYLESGKKKVAKRYLCRSRSPWYSQENRPAPLFLCTYMGRSRLHDNAAFRFILNHSKATAANVYLLLYPREELRHILQDKPERARMVWMWLKSLPPDVVKGEGRVYGGGLHKLEPRELGNVPVDEILGFLGMSVSKKPVQMQMSFFTHSA
jgi:hypothetical protein